MVMVVTGACGGTVDSTGGAASSYDMADSSGVRIVHNRTPVAEHPWTIGSEPRLVIGGMVSDELLHRVVGAVRTPDSMIAVLNGNPVQVLLVDRSGVVVRTFGRDGGGPGEFRRPVHISTDDAGIITVWDADFGPGYGFDSSGRLVKEHHLDLERLLSALGSGTGAEYRVPLPGHGILVPVARRGTTTDPTTSWHARWGLKSYLIMDSLYQVTDAGTYYSGVDAVKVQASGAGLMVSPMLFHLSHAVASVSPFRLHLSDAARYLVDVRDSRGQLLMSIRKAHVPRQMDDTLLTRLDREVGAQYRTLPEPEYRAAKAVLPDPTRFPVILGLLVDVHGNLWVRETMREWSVFDSEGVWVTTVDVPLFKVYEIGDDYVLGLSVDPDGLESVVELALDRR
jgi:hypothetical protein